LRPPARPQAANLTAIFDDPTLNVTLFAPTDEAFLGLLSVLNVSADALVSRASLVARVLQYHVLSGVLYSDELSPALDGKAFPTLLEGEKLAVSWPKSAPGPSIKTSSGQLVSIAEYDIEAGDSVVHLVPEVLLAKSVLADPIVQGLLAQAQKQ
jgi:uncharacterized surface protein with fasciclin (FAS1) repeats